jgi:hypothetical protein
MQGAFAAGGEVRRKILRLAHGEMVIVRVRKQQVLKLRQVDFGVLWTWARVSGGRSILITSSIRTEARVRQSGPPRRLASRQIGQSQKMAGIPSAAPVPRKKTFIEPLASLTPSLLPLPTLPAALPASSRLSCHYTRGIPASTVT